MQRSQDRDPAHELCRPKSSLSLTNSQARMCKLEEDYCDHRHDKVHSLAFRFHGMNEYTRILGAG